MAKNLMPEIIKMLGLEYGEVFRVSEQDAETAEDGLFCFNKEGGLIKINPDGSTCTAWEILYDILNGWCEIVKVPWEPKYKEYYYCPSVTERRVIELLWLDDTRDYALKALGMVYKTKKEAKEHLAEDYMRLTGEPWSSR